MSNGTTIIEEEMAAAAAAATKATTTTRRRLRRPEWVSKSKKKKNQHRNARAAAAVDDDDRRRPKTVDGPSGRPMDARRPGPVHTAVLRAQRSGCVYVCMCIYVCVHGAWRMRRPVRSCARARATRDRRRCRSLRVHRVILAYIIPPPELSFVFHNCARQNIIISSGAQPRERIT